MTTAPNSSYADAMALTSAAVTMIQRGEDQQALDLLDGLINLHPHPVEPSLRWPIASALFNKGVALKHLDRRTDEIAVYDEVWRRFGADADLQVSYQVARCLVNRSVTTNAIGAYQESLDPADEVLRRCSDHPAPELRVQAAKALFLKANALDGLGRTAEVPALVAEIDRRARAEAGEPEVLEALADAQVRIRRAEQHNGSGIVAKLRGYVAPPQQLPPEAADGAPAVLPGLVMATAVLDGDRVDFVASTSMAALGGTEAVWRHAMRNLETLDGIDVVREEVRPDRDDTTLFTLSGADPFVGSRVAVYEWLVEALTGAGSVARGVLLAVPSRHRLVLHVISGPGTLPVAEAAALAVHHTHQQAGAAAISPWLYFVTPDRRAQQVSSEVDGGVAFHATTLLLEAIDASPGR